MSARVWTKERHDCLRAHVDGTRLSGGAFDASEDDAADMLDEIERLTAALKAADDRAAAAEHRLRQLQGGSYAGMLDRT